MDCELLPFILYLGYVRIVILLVTWIRHSAGYVGTIDWLGEGLLHGGRFWSSIFYGGPRMHCRLRKASVEVLETNS